MTDPLTHISTQDIVSLHIHDAAKWREVIDGTMSVRCFNLIQQHNAKAYALKTAPGGKDE